MFILARHRDVPRIQLFAKCLRKGPLQRFLSLTPTSQVMSGPEMLY